MKKRIIATLIAAIMFVSILPTTGMAALTYYGNKMVDINFTSFVKNTSSANNKTMTTVTLSGAGTAADFEPVGGLFGKAADDMAAKITRITSSKDAASLASRVVQNDNGCPEPGNFIDISWEWAFGDMNVERYVNASFYKEGHSWNVVNSFAYDANGNNVADILRISPNGSVRFFGKTLEDLYYFETDTWYNFTIRIEVGTNTDTANEVAGKKALAKLYIDGIEIGEKEINNAKDDATTIFNPHCLYNFSFVSKAAKYAAASESLAETTYLDNITSGKYKPGANAAEYRYMRDYTITSKSDNFITDGLHIALKNPVTAAELKADLSYIAGDDQGISSVTIAGPDRVTLADDAVVTPGCYIVPRTKSSGQWHVWYRKIVDRITYMYNSFDGVEPARVPTAAKISDTVGSYSSTVNYALTEVAKCGDVTKAMMIDKYGTGWAGALGARYDTGYKGTVDSDKYVVEARILRDSQSDDYPNLAFRINTMTFVSVGPEHITTHEDDEGWPPYSMKKVGHDNRWIKVAVEVDETEGTAKIYIDGEYTGTSKTKWNGIDNCYTYIGILTDCKNLNGSFGKSYIDDIKLYSGSYTESLEVASTNENIVVAANDILKVANDITAEELIAATGADAIYTYADREFVAPVTSGTLPGNAVAIFRDDDSDIVRYFDIVYAPVMGDVEFDTSVAGKITANVVINNKSDLNMYKNAKLIIASYDNSGAGKKLVAVDFDANSALTVGENPLSATIDFDESKEVVAYLWKANNAPYVEAVPYIG